MDRYSRTDRAIVAAVSEMVTCGVSTRKVERVAKTLGVERLGKDTVSRMCATLDETVEDLQGRAFHGLRFPYLWLDATYIKAREGGHVNSMAVVTAIAAADDGHRYLVGIDAADTESYASWLGFLRGLRDRGITGVLLQCELSHKGLRWESWTRWERERLEGWGCAHNPGGLEPKEKHSWRTQKKYESL